MSNTIEGDELFVGRAARAKRGPKPRVEHDGKVYTCRAWKVTVPDLAAMDGTGALVWLLRNTIPTGNGIRSTPEPHLRGLTLKVL